MRELLEGAIINPNDVRRLLEAAILLARWIAAVLREPDLNWSWPVRCSIRRTTMKDMNRWGLSPFFEEAFDPHRGEGRLLGRVVRSGHPNAAIVTEWGKLPVHVPHGSDGLVVGDWVVCDPSQARVLMRLPRRTAVARKRPGRAAREQVLCANVDLAFVLTGLDDDFSLRRIERYLALAASAGLEAVLVMTKADLCAQVEARITEVERVAAGRPVIAACVPRNERVDGIRSHLPPGVTAMLLGSSGVGKSTLLNALLGEARAKTKEVMDDGRGRHTTTHRELFCIPGGGVIVDAPGLREVGLIETGSVASAFHEVTELASRCRFNDCRHEGEPGCAIESALARGELNPERFDAYRALCRETMAHERRASEHTRRRHDKAHPAIRLRRQRRRQGP